MSSGPTLSTADPELLLTPINIERDASAGVRWLQGDTGRETLRNMGVATKDNQESSLGVEQQRLRQIVDDPQEMAWMLQYQGNIVGILELRFADTEYILAPHLSIMIGDTSLRGKGIGTNVVAAALNYLTAHGYAQVHARHLVDNHASGALLTKSGFTDDGELYRDTDELVWQNMKR